MVHSSYTETDFLNKRKKMASLLFKNSLQEMDFFEYVCIMFFHSAHGRHDDTAHSRPVKYMPDS